MAVLNFSYATIKDAGKFREYVVAAKALLDEAGVDVVVRGDFFDVMQGEKVNPHVVAVFRYHDNEAVKLFYSSPTYQALVPLRDAACDMEIVLYDEMV